VLVSPAALTLEELALFNELFVARFGLCFPEHKRQILASRLEPRLRAHHLTRFLDYYLLLHYDFDGERDDLIRSITNNESYFFRETAQFEALANEAAVALRAGGPRPGSLRFLSAGCSSGEEPYTLRIYDCERRFGLGTAAEIDAVDIDPERIELARQARYRASSLRTLDEARVGRYFHPDGARGGVRGVLLRQPFRDGVGFRRGNLVDRSSLPREPYDAVFCRNVLIYFSESALKRTVDNFATLVRPGGLLFLGHAESIIGMTRAFHAERLGATIAYRREPT